MRVLMHERACEMKCIHCVYAVHVDVCLVCVCLGAGNMNVAHGHPLLRPTVPGTEPGVPIMGIVPVNPHHPHKARPAPPDWETGKLRLAHLPKGPGWDTFLRLPFCLLAVIFKKGRGTKPPTAQKDPFSAGEVAD